MLSELGIFLGVKEVLNAFLLKKLLRKDKNRCPPPPRLCPLLTEYKVAEWNFASSALLAKLSYNQ